MISSKQICASINFSLLPGYIHVTFCNTKTTIKRSLYKIEWTIDTLNDTIVQVIDTHHKVLFSFIYPHWMSWHLKGSFWPPKVLNFTYQSHKTVTSYKMKLSKHTLQLHIELTNTMSHSVDLKYFEWNEIDFRGILCSSIPNITALDTLVCGYYSLQNLT